MTACHSHKWTKGCSFGVIFQLFSRRATAFVANDANRIARFVPMDEIPPEEELPAAPLVMTAYAVAWAIVIGYLWTIWKRLGNVEKELADVGRRVSAGDRAGTGA